MSDCFILLAAGKSKRFKSNTLKQFINYKNKALFMHSIEKAIKSNLFKEIVLVTKNKIPNLLIEGLGIKSELCFYNEDFLMVFNNEDQILNIQDIINLIFIILGDQ